MSTYLTVAECATVIATVLPSTDQGRIALAAMSADDQLVMIRQATRLVDGLVYEGRALDITQALSWPRIRRDDGTLIDPDPAPPANPAVGSIPRAVREAVAITAATLALRAVGGDYAGDEIEAASRGVMSRSMGGASVSFGPHAMRAEARLPVAAITVLEPYLACGVEGV